MFVAVAYDDINANPCNVAASSTDGITWTVRTLPSSQYWNSVAYGNGMFVTTAVGSNASAYSSDGITWTALALPASEEWWGIAYGNGRFVAVAGGDAAAASIP